MIYMLCESIILSIIAHFRERKWEPGIKKNIDLRSVFLYFIYAIENALVVQRCLRCIIFKLYICPVLRVM